MVKRSWHPKAQMRATVLMILAGVILLVGGLSSDRTNPSLFGIGMLLLVIGFVWLIAVKLVAWWHHG